MQQDLYRRGGGNFSSKIQFTIANAEQGAFASDNDSRVAYDDLNASWEADDVIKVGYEGNTSYDLTTAEGGDQASFTGQITAPSSSTAMYAYYAAEGRVTVTPDYSAKSINIKVPTAQTGEMNNHNVGVAQFDVNPEAIVDGQYTLADNVTFKPLLSRLDIKLNNLNGATVRKIEVKLDGAEFLTECSSDFEGNIVGGSQSTDLITIDPKDDNTKDLYSISVVPVDFTTAPTMDVIVTTEGTDNNKIYTAGFTAKPKLETGYRYTATVDLATATSKDVTYVDDLTEDVIQNIKDNLDGYYILNGDVTVNALADIEDFAGTFDGNGHTITLNPTTTEDHSHAGFFSTTSGNATVKNLTVELNDILEADVSEGGLIVGMVNHGSTLTLENVHGMGNIEVDKKTEGTHMFGGGLVGWVPYDSKINANNCSFSGSITTHQSVLNGNSTAANSYVGGIVGSVETGVTDFTTTNEYAGSQAGSASSITNCTVNTVILTNTVGAIASGRAEIYTGSIAGRCTGTIKDCTASNVVITAEVGANGSGKQAKPIVGNDWYDNTNNTNNVYNGIQINGADAINGTYNATANGPEYTERTE